MREREREGLQVLVFIFRTLVIQTFTFNLGQGTGEESYGSKLFSEREYVAIQRIFWQPHLFVLCLIWWSPFPLVPICSSLVLPESHAALVTSNWEPWRNLKRGVGELEHISGASVWPAGIFSFSFFYKNKLFVSATCDNDITSRTKDSHHDIHKSYQ